MVLKMVLLMLHEGENEAGNSNDYYLFIYFQIVSYYHRLTSNLPSSCLSFTNPGIVDVSRCTSQRLTSLEISPKATVEVQGQVLDTSLGQGRAGAEGDL